MSRRTKLLLAYPAMVLTAAAATSLGAVLDLNALGAYGVVAGVGVLTMAACFAWIERLTPSRLRDRRAGVR